MNGAESLVHSLVASGVDTCFANPGTSEMHFVSALDRAASKSGFRSVLGLFEGVAAGAADGYGRMAGKPAATLFHCGPGLANGLSMLHNARRAGTPIVNIVGDQATYHAPLDPPLAADIEAWARPISCCVKRVADTLSLGRYAAEAVQAARSPNGGIATLILPSDVSWGDGGVPGAVLSIPSRAKADSAVIKECARVLRSGEATLILLGGAALDADALAQAGRIAAATGAKIMAPTFNARIARGAGRYPIDSIPYPVDQAVAATSGIRHIILVGAKVPVAFFAYQDKPGIVTPGDAKAHTLATPEQDLLDALHRLANELGAEEFSPTAKSTDATLRTGHVTPDGAAQILAALLPENAVVVDEAITLRAPFFAATQNANPHDWLQIPGGAIGGGMPVATGAAVAAPSRRVIVLQGDGSAMYTVQALWTQARENLDVTTIILSNRAYAILFLELNGIGATPGHTARDLFELDRPGLDWRQMAHSMGVEAGRAETLEDFADLLRHANGRKGPFLIDLAFA